MKDSRLAREEGVFAEGTPQWMSRKDWCMVGCVSSAHAAGPA